MKRTLYYSTRNGYSVFSIDHDSCDGKFMYLSEMDQAQRKLLLNFIHSNKADVMLNLDCYHIFASCSKEVEQVFYLKGWRAQK